MITKEKPEKTENSLQELYNPDYLYNKAIELITDYSLEPLNNITGSLHDISHNQFNDCLHFIGAGLFSGVDLSKDPLLRLLALDLYINISNKFDKIISCEGYSYISLIPDEVVKLYAADAGHVKKDRNIKQLISALYNIYQKTNLISEPITNNIYIYNNNSVYLNNNIYIGVEGITPDVITDVNGIIFNKLHTMREAGIKNRLLSDKQQLGTVAIANREYNWSADRIAHEERARSLTLADLPKLSSYVNTPALTESAESEKTADL